VDVPEPRALIKKILKEIKTVFLNTGSMDNLKKVKRKVKIQDLLSIDFGSKEFNLPKIKAWRSENLTGIY